MLGIMGMAEVEFRVLGIIVILLLIGYLWLRRIHSKRQRRILTYATCKDLILNKRHALASVGADFERLAGLVTMDITPEQLERVIELLTAPRVKYNIDSLEDPDSLEVNLDFSKTDASRKAKKKKVAEEPTEEPSETPTDLSSLDPADEETWLRLAHKRFQRALAAKDITDRRDQVKLLATMVRLGRKAVEDDPNKPVARKAYERELWDRFYEKEYLDINS